MSDTAREQYEQTPSGGGQASAPVTVVIPLFDGVTQLDFTGPYQMLSLWPGARLIPASVGGRPVTTAGLTFTALADLAELDTCDVLLVPGGRNATEPAQDPVFLAAVRRLAASARYITSVCTGSLILAAAGVVTGKRMACHWAWRDILPLFGVIPDEARFVRDGNVLSGGGVTAGIDFGLILLAELAGQDTAEAVQLYIEYDPAPPFPSGRPETAPAHVLAAVQAGNAAFIPARHAEFAQIARAQGRTAHPIPRPAG